MSVKTRAWIAVVMMPVMAQTPHWQMEAKSWVRTEKATACKGATRVKVAGPGKVKVVAENRTDVAYAAVERFPVAVKQDAERRAATIETKAVEQGGWCVITTRGSDGRSFISELTVVVPRTTKQCKLESRGGAVTAKYLFGDVEAATNAGDVEMDEVAGSVVARTGGGSMTFGTVKGGLRALSGGGSIRVKRVGGEAALETAGGDITVEEAGGLLRAGTAGNIQVGRAGQAVFAHTSGGLIDIAQAGGLVTAESGGGGIQVGQAKGVRCESAGGTIRVRSVGGSVRASTMNGNVYAVLEGGAGLEDSLLATGRGDITVSLASNMQVTVKALNESPGWGGRIVTDFSEIQVQNRETGRGRPLVAQGQLNGGGPVLMLSTTNGTIVLKRQR